MREESGSAPNYSSNLVRFFAPLLLLLQVSAYFGNLFWALDLLAHLQAQFFLAGITLLIVSLFARSLKFAGICMLSLGLSTSALMPLYVPVTTVAVSELRLRVVSLNVLTSNKEYQRVENYLKSASPDVLLLIEIDAEWMKQLEGALADYPHRLAHPREDNFGIGLFSKLPLEGAEIRSLGGSLVPSVTAHIRTPQGLIRFLGSHTIPPMGENTTKMRDNFLAAVFQEAKQSAVPMIVGGDFNATRWSSSLRGLLSTGSLIDSSNGFGFRPTWFGGRQPDWLIATGLLGIPIDILLHTNQLAVIESKVGPPVGSDHCGLEVTFGWVNG